MNIFKILSEGDGSINEPNISSFLAYLLEPTASHGLGSKLLEDILSKIILKEKDEFEHFIIKDKIVDLSRYSNFETTVQTELKTKTNKGRDRDIDIVIEINNKLGDEKIVICIENKIKANSASKGQINDEIEGIKNQYSKEEKTIKYIFIYLVPQTSDKINEEFQSAIVNIEDGFSAKELLLWKSDNTNDNTILSILIKLLSDEINGNIDPIDTYSKHTIKAFIQFIKTDFKSFVAEKKDMEGKYMKKYLNSLVEYGKYMKSQYRTTDEALNLIAEIEKHCRNQFEEKRLKVTYTPTYIKFHIDEDLFLAIQNHGSPSYKFVFIEKFIDSSNTDMERKDWWYGAYDRGNYTKYEGKDNTLWKTLESVINYIKNNY